MPKRALREEARASRRAIPLPQREEKSRRIMEHVLAIPQIENAKTLGCYVSKGSEVDTRLLLRSFLAKGVVVAVPLTLGDQLLFARLDHPWALTEGAHGILEPRRPWSEVSGEDLDVIIVPGLRFGRDGSRLGNGGGHFDRYLAAHPKALRIALAFEAQMEASVHTETHDESMDIIVTEEGRTRIGRPAKT